MSNQRLENDYYVEPRKYGSKGFSYLTLELRKKLQAMLEDKQRIRVIANALGISRGTIYHERMRMGGVDVPYDAVFAHQDCENKRRVNSRQREEIPRAYSQGISKIYRLIQGVMTDSMSAQAKYDLKQCLCILERMNANPEKMKRPLTNEECITILEHWKNGKTYTEIEVLTGRSRSTVSHIVSVNRDKLDTPKDEIEYDKLKDKWLTE